MKKPGIRHTVMTTVLCLMLFVTGCAASQQQTTHVPSSDASKSSAREAATSFATSAGNGADQITADESKPSNSSSASVTTDSSAPKALPAEPADDELDFMFKDDHYYNETIKIRKIQDAKAYEAAYGFRKPSVSDIEKAIRENPDIPSKYQDFIVSYASDWLRLYPGADLSNLLLNAQTLQLYECTPYELAKYGTSIDALAFYKTLNNAIYINQDGNFLDKSTEDYVTLVHELIHATRNTTSEIDGVSVTTRFAEQGGKYAYIDEAIVSHISYDIQGAGNKSRMYTLASSYFRIIFDCLGDRYTPEDYMNHSMHYLVYQMDQYMGDDRALSVLTLLNTQMKVHYQSGEDEDYQPLYDYLISMYCKKYLQAGMSKEEAESLFTSFTDDITFDVETFSKPFPGFSKEVFREQFEKECAEKGIL